MGGSVEARCACGYRAEVVTGCGMAGPTPCWFPALCARCGEAVPADIAVSPPRCGHCGDAATAYCEPDLLGRQGRRVVTSERAPGAARVTHRLKDGTYRCPKCGEFALRFSIGGLCWD